MQVESIDIFRVGTDVMKTVKSLVNDGADIHAQNNNGLTPLHVARGEEATEACLLHASDQSFTITDKRRRKFWHLLFIFRNQGEIESATNTYMPRCLHQAPCIAVMI